MTKTVPKNYAIVDIETTGSAAKNHKITEIAIYIFDGDKIIDSYETLINPERRIDDRIFSLTGINTEMVENAPKFYEVAKKIAEILKDKIFVAHNVGFDYSFIKKEFSSLGYKLNLKRLCTVRLSRKLIPGKLSYSLGNLCDSLGIEIKARHRAGGDALATVELFKRLIDIDNDKHIEKSLQFRSYEASLPPNLSKEKFDQIPEKCGVYYFHDNKGKVIYVGKAKNIKSRFKSHCNNTSTKATNMKSNIFDVSWEITGNELAALLLESKEIKHIYPKYNISQKRRKDNFGIGYFENSAGYIQIMLDRISNLKTESQISFVKQPEAMSFLRMLLSKYQLCGKLTGLHKSSGRCWNYQIKQCKGACCGEEIAEDYNKRARQAIASFSISYQTFAIIEKGRTTNEKCAILIENGTYKGFGYFNPNIHPIISITDIKTIINLNKDNGDIRKILNRYLNSKTRKKIIQFDKVHNSTLKLF